MPDPPHCLPPASVSTHLANISAMDGVLSLSEILHLVFSFLSLGCNTNNARVCKQWCEIALDNIWCNITDVTCLFRLLAPLSQSRRLQKFSRLPGLQDWARFEKYGKRTRVLHFQDGNFSVTTFKEVFDVLGRHRPKLEILPQLHTLKWTTGSIQSVTQDSVLFMHQNVKKFTVSIPSAADSHYDDLPYFFGTLVARMSRLTHLVLESQLTLSVIENHGIELLLGLSELKHITLPICHLPSRIAEWLSRMNNLETLDLDMDHWAPETEESTEAFAPCLAEGAFPSLRSLSLKAHLKDVSQFLNSSFAPHAVSKIHIVSRSPSPESSLAVQSFLSGLASTCPNLEDIRLFLLTPNTMISMPPPPHHIITYDAFRPICGPALKYFEISHPHPVHVTLDDLDDVARKCPSLFRFILNCDPAILNSDHQLPLTAITPFARHCPHIETLGLFFSAATSNLVGTEDLTVGTSDIDEDVGPTTQFLSHMCTLGCEIEVIIEWPGTFGVNIDGVKDLLELRKTRWSQVGCMLPVLEKLRKKDKEKMRHLEERVKAIGEQLNTLCECRLSREDIEEPRMGGFIV